MILYASIGPNPRVVTMFVAEKGLAIETRQVDIIKGENRDPAGDYRQVHPGGTTPALVLDDGSTLTETVAICEYLKAVAADGLAAIEAGLEGDWIAGDRFTLADIALFSFVEFGAMVGQPLPEGLPRLAAWRERVAARRSAAG